MEKRNQRTSKLIKERQNKSKVQHLINGTRWNTGEPATYMNKLSRNETSILFKARTRMLHVKDNFRNKYTNNLMCRACGLQVETQKHTLNECSYIHTNENTKIKEEDYFNENIEELRQAKKKI